MLPSICRTHPGELYQPPNKPHKPQPYVFGKSRASSGIGLSGPGGLLWPTFPSKTNQLSSDMNVAGLIPGLMVNMSTSFGNDIYVGDANFSIYVDISVNTQALIHRGVNALIPDIKPFISYEGADFYDADEDIDPPEDPLWISFYTFAKNGPIGHAVYDELVDNTDPFPLTISLGGGCTLDVGSDNRTALILFNTLVLKVMYTDGDNIPTYEWIYDIEYTSNTTDINVTTGTKTIYLSQPYIRIELESVYAISHPEQTGCVSVMIGGVQCMLSMSYIFNIHPIVECDRVLGPIWLPHTTFFPLVEIGNTLLPRGILHGSVDALDSVSGYGVFIRNASSIPPEIMVPGIQELLKYPNPTSELPDGNFFYPNYNDVKILDDSCIFPITGPVNEEKMDDFKKIVIQANKSYY